MGKFQNKVLDLTEEFISPGEKGVPVFFKFDELKMEDIHYDKKKGYGIKPGCSCSADYQVTKEGINIAYNDNTSKENVKAQPTKELIITKDLTVYLNDGLPLKVRNKRGVMQYNKNKDSEIIKFRLRVKA